eukprot:gene5178-5830_t
MRKGNKETKAIDNNLNPVWNEEFVLPIPDGEETLAFSVWDKNTLSKDNFMGFAYASISDCPKDRDTQKVLAMKGHSAGEITVIVTPDFETTGVRLQRVSQEVNNNAEENGKLQGELGNFRKEVDHCEVKSTRCQRRMTDFQLITRSWKKKQQVNKMTEENGKFEAIIRNWKESNAKLEGEVNRLEGEVNRMAEENNKFAANNKKLEGEVNRLEGEVSKMAEENKKFEANNQKLEGEMFTVHAINLDMCWVSRVQQICVSNKVNRLQGEVEKMAKEQQIRC